MADTKENLIVKLIDPSEYRKELIELLTEVFCEERDTEEFIWKYEKNPYGKMHVWSVWDLNLNVMVAAFSAYKRLFIYQSTIVPVYQQADAVVKKGYRGMGLFSLLINMISEHAIKEGAIFHFGYTNDLSAKVMIKFPDARELYVSNVFVFMNGTQDLANTYLKARKLPSFIIKYLGTPIIKGYNYIRGYYKEPDSYTLESLETFPDSIEEWSFNMAKAHQYFPLRDNKYLNWKSMEVPDKQKKDLMVYWCLEKTNRIGYCILYRDESRNIIKLIDLLADNILSLRKCLNAIRYYAIQHNFDAITTNAASKVYSEALEAEGFIKVKKVRSTVFFLNKSHLTECKFDDTFWMQLPIDRDNFGY